MSAHTIGERIRAVRQRAGLTLDRFATALGVSRRSVVNWEQSAAEPPIAVLAKLRSLYDVDPEWVVSGEDLTPRAHYAPTDWTRFDRIARDVKAACVQVGMEFSEDPGVIRELVRGLFDEDPGNDAANARQMRRTLLAISKGKRA